MPPNITAAPTGSKATHMMKKTIGHTGLPIIGSAGALPGCIRRTNMNISLFGTDIAA